MFDYYSDQKLYFLKGFNPLPLNDRFEEKYTLSWFLFVSKSPLKIEKWVMGLWNYET